MNVFVIFTINASIFWIASESDIKEFMVSVCADYEQHCKDKFELSWNL